MLSRKSPMKRTAMRAARPKPSISAKGRALLAERSGGACEARLPGCWLRATDACHRRAREEGREEQLSDYWHGCRVCHEWTHRNPAAAYELGLMLKQHQNPLDEPMAYMNAGWVRLDDSGHLWPVGDEAA